MLWEETFPRLIRTEGWHIDKEPPFSPCATTLQRGARHVVFHSKRGSRFKKRLMGMTGDDLQRGKYNGHLQHEECNEATSSQYSRLFSSDPGGPPTWVIHPKSTDMPKSTNRSIWISGKEMLLPGLYQDYHPTVQIYHRTIDISYK